MRYLTDFADQAVILPVVLAVAVTLALQGWRRGAITWLVVVMGTFAATLCAKLMFLSCSPLFGPMDVQSPSGHVAAATVVTGGLAAMLTRRRDSIIPAALVAAVVIGLSRLLLGMHSLPEVIIGALIGLAGAAALMRFAGRPPALRLSPLIAVVVIVATVLHGLHLPAEAAIRHTAYRAAQFIPACRGTPVWRHRGTG
ncbi:phosphatase PAP2 family protein [Rhodopila sp.]|uniref:phosphatase PAP2 family protein n=1 Tax=Rhodopila sp. TaxID=2480087 RepID=UPI003D130DA3